MHRTSFDANQEELMNYKLPPQALLFALLSLEFSDTNPPLSTLSLSLSLQLPFQYYRLFLVRNYLLSFDRERDRNRVEVKLVVWRGRDCCILKQGFLSLMENVDVFLRKKKKPAGSHSYRVSKVKTLNFFFPGARPLLATPSYATGQKTLTTTTKKAQHIANHSS